MKRKTVAVSVALVCSALSLGIGIAAANDFKSASPTDQLSEFVGNGVCTGNVMAMGKKPGHATTGKYSGTKILDGNWIELRYDEDSSVAAPRPFHVVQYFRYDKARMRYVSVLVDNSGSGYSTGTSAGWKGDGITFDEAEAGQPVAYRDTFTRSVSSGMSRHMGKMRDEHGKWIKTDEENCKPT